MAIKIFAYISPVCRETPLGQIYMKFCMGGHLADIISRAKFISVGSGVLILWRGQIFGFLIGKRSRR